MEIQQTCDGIIVRCHLFIRRKSMDDKSANFYLSVRVRNIHKTQNCSKSVQH